MSKTIWVKSRIQKFSAYSSHGPNSFFKNVINIIIFLEIDLWDPSIAQRP